MTKNRAMDEILESLAELVRSLSRLHNNNKGLLLNCDIERLEKAKDILSRNASGDERGRVTTSSDNCALNNGAVNGLLLIQMQQFIDNAIFNHNADAVPMHPQDYKKAMQLSKKLSRQLSKCNER